VASFKQEFHRFRIAAAAGMVDELLEEVEVGGAGVSPGLVKVIGGSVRFEFEDFIQERVECIDVLETAIGEECFGGFGLAGLAKLSDGDGNEAREVGFGNEADGVGEKCSGFRKLLEDRLDQGNEGGAARVDEAMSKRVGI